MTTPTRRRALPRLAALAAATVVAAGALSVAPVTAAAATDRPGEGIYAGTDVSDLVLTIGADSTSRNLAWYSSRNDVHFVQVVKEGEEFTNETPAIEAWRPGKTTSLEYNQFATLSGLEPNTTYSYRVGSAKTGWTQPLSFTTGAGTGDFEFLLFGDPQVGASGNLAADEAGWVDTVDLATQSHPGAEMLFSVGDQVEVSFNERHYDAFLAPRQLREMPLVTVNGNHDVGSKAYEQHFNLPNVNESAGRAALPTSSGGDYWFIYNDVLFVVLNSNNPDVNAHEQFVRDVVAAHGDEATWKVMSFHHSIFSVAKHYKDLNVRRMRESFPPLISELGFDVVLQGHDHSYTRSYLLDENGRPAQELEESGQDLVEAGDGEVLYLTANSASGSKFYDVKAPDAEYVSVINQEKIRNYTKVDVTADTLTFDTYRSEPSGGGETNSLVDSVVLTRASEEPDPEPPAPEPEPPAPGPDPEPNEPGDKGPGAGETGPGPRPEDPDGPTGDEDDPEGRPPRGEDAGRPDGQGGPEEGPGEVDETGGTGEPGREDEAGEETTPGEPGREDEAGEETTPGEPGREDEAG
ncbi:purple acid phosphatase family protein, partial [Corynebacterium otitidis]|uniref:purple acid phosphatase family protein n=1 Tax=Corynebacterium otitidis TaxID=29321 RepID=UPI000AA37EC7